MRFHPTRVVLSSVLVILLSGLYAAGTGVLILEFVQATTRLFSLDWSPAQLSVTSRTAGSILWFAFAVPVFLAGVFRSFLVSVAWEFLHNRSWVESTRRANEKLAAWYLDRNRERTG